MVRRSGYSEIVTHSGPPKKKNRTLSETYNLQTDVTIDKPLPLGEILIDVTQKQWRIGKPIGHGSFGEIYLASDEIHEDVTLQNSRYVIKVEPHSNGPLFVEIHCLIRTARHSKIKKWQDEKKLDFLGMPHYIANGSHIFNDTRYRFLVLPRYDCDIEKIINLSNPHLIEPKNVLVLATQIIDILEYLHAHGYVHSDIKSSNLMIGFDGAIFNDKKPQQLNIPCKKSTNKNCKPKTKYGSYYYDEDFVLHNYLSSSSNTDYETDEDCVVKDRSKRVHGNLRKNMRIKTPIDTKNARNNRLFNLRKIKSEVSYEDFNSSICSYDSYQDLIENNNNREHDIIEENIENEVDHFKEAIQTQSSGQVYLLDFGLALKFVNSDGSHKEYVMDQRKAHDGTLEYSSRDSHIGAHSRRSDFENLGYNIIDWLTGSLPWKTPTTLADPDLVHAIKKNYMKDVKRFMEVCFKSEFYPKVIENFFLYIQTLEFNDKPDYQYCKNLFIKAFIESGYGSERDMILNFVPKLNFKKSNAKKTSPDILKRNAIVKVYGRENFHMNSWENSLKMDLIRSFSNDGIRKPCVSRNFFVSDADLITKLRQSLLLNHDTPSKKFSPKNLRSAKKVIKKKKGGRNVKNSIGKFGNFLGSNRQYTWAEILAENPERIIRKIDKEKNPENLDNSIENGKHNQNKRPRSRKISNASDISMTNLEINPSPNLLRNDFLVGLNPTYAMKEVVANYKRKIQGKPPLKSNEINNDINGSKYTPAMIQVMQNMEKRRKREKLLEEKNCKKEALAAKKLLSINKKETPSKSTVVKKNAKNVKKIDLTNPKVLSGCKIVPKRHIPRLQETELNNSIISKTKSLNRKNLMNDGRAAKRILRCHTIKNIKQVEFADIPSKVNSELNKKIKKKNVGKINKNTKADSGKRTTRTKNSNELENKNGINECTDMEGITLRRSKRACTLL